MMLLVFRTGLFSVAGGWGGTALCIEGCSVAPLTSTQQTLAVYTRTCTHTHTVATAPNVSRGCQMVPKRNHPAEDAWPSASQHVEQRACLPEPWDILSSPLGDAEPLPALTVLAPHSHRLIGRVTAVDVYWAPTICQALCYVSYRQRCWNGLWGAQLAFLGSHRR